MSQQSLLQCVEEFIALAQMKAVDLKKFVPESNAQRRKHLLREVWAATPRPMTLEQMVEQLFDEGLPIPLELRVTLELEPETKKFTPSPSPTENRSMDRLKKDKSGYIQDIYPDVPSAPILDAYEQKQNEDRVRQAEINVRFNKVQASIALKTMSDDTIIEIASRVLTEEQANTVPVERNELINALLSLDDLSPILKTLNELFPPAPKPSPKKEVPVKKIDTVLIEKINSLDRRLSFCPYVMYGWDLNHQGQPVFRGDGYSHMFANREDTQIIAFHIDKEVFRDATTDKLIKKSLYLTDVERDRRVNVAMKLLNDPSTIFAAWDDGKLVVYRDLTGKRKWMSPFTDSGVNFRIDRKTMKRSQSLASPYLLVARFPRTELKVKFITDTDPRLEDGWMQISDQAYSKCLEQYRGYPGHALRNERHYERLQSAKIHSFRMVIPSQVSDLLPSGGMAKGHCSVTPTHKMDGYDLIIHLKANVKSEVMCYGSEFILGFNPQCEPEPASTNIQFLINYKETLFSAEIVRSWVRIHLNHVRYMYATGLPIEKAADFALQKAKDEDQSEEDQIFDSSIMMRARWNAFQVCYHGERVHSFPSLDKQIWKAYTGLLFEKNKHGETKAHIHVDIPCSRFAQVIGQTAASRSGYDHTIPDGKVSWWEELGVAVVSDTTWLKMIKNHGGCDKDDKFALIYRIVSGVKGVFILRSPNSIGEWSFLEAYGQFDCPTSVKHEFTDGKATEVEYTWPEVNFTLDQMPQQVSEMPPRKPLEPAPFESEWSIYTREFVFDKLLTSSKNFSTGNYPNSLMLFTLLCGKASQNTPCTLEEAIDWMTQMSDPEIAAKIQKWCKEVLDFTIENKVPVDKLFAVQFPGRIRSQFNLVDGYFVKLHNNIKKDIELVRAWIDAACPWEMPRCVAKTVYLPPEDLKKTKEVFQWFLSNRHEHQTKGTYDELKMKVYELLKVSCPILTLKKFHAFAKLCYLHSNVKGIDYILMSNPRGSDGKEVEGLWSLYLKLLQCGGVHPQTPKQEETPEKISGISDEDFGTNEEVKITSVADEMAALLK